LLAAANEPDRLQDVDPTVTRVRAADLLSLEDDPALPDDAVAIMREAVELALPPEIEMARDGLAKTLAAQGNLAELDALVRTVLTEPSSLTSAYTLLGICPLAAIFGYGRQAAGWLDEAIAATGTGRSGPGRQRVADRNARQVLEDTKRRLPRIRSAMAADGCDPDDPAAARQRMRTRPVAVATVSTHPPWPAGFQGRLVWWPEPEYARLVRQLPEMATLLGGPWRGHTARVQAAMTGGAPPVVGADPAAGADSLADGAAPPHSLVAAEFTQFAEFVEWSRADPLAPGTMTAFGALAGKLTDPVRWPPRDRAACWCGSGMRYRDCCARARAAAQPADAVHGTQS
jgi:hypothetical protein